jgi:hypothetical protein
LVLRLTDDAALELGEKGIPSTSGSSPVENVLAPPINPPWAIAGTARRVVWRNCAPDFDGEPVKPCRSNLEECRGNNAGRW